MRDAAGDGRKALKILRDHYASKGKPRIIALYTELTSLVKGANETVTEYLIRAERSITALKNAKETLSSPRAKTMGTRLIFTQTTSPSLIHPWAAPGFCNLFSLSVELPCVQQGKCDIDN